MEMRLSYIIGSINRRLEQAVYGQDVIDDKLSLFSMTSSGFITQIPLSLLKSFIWVSRKILTAFMLAGHLISRMVVR